MGVMGGGGEGKEGDGGEGKEGDGAVYEGDGTVYKGDGAVYEGDGAVYEGDGAVYEGDGATSVPPPPPPLPVAALVYEGDPDALIKLCENDEKAPDMAEVRALIEAGIGIRNRVCRTHMLIRC